MDFTYIWPCILAMGIVTYIPRLLPLLLLSKLQLPKWFSVWLKYVPTTVFGALIFSEIFVREQGLNLQINNAYLLASLGSFAIALKTKSLAMTIAAGMLFFWLLQKQEFFPVSF